MSNLLDNLNQEQKEAATHTDGPLLIIAGAGTGKTTVITKKIAYLIEQGLAKPDEILALTFTDKSAGEMEERVDRLLPYGYVDLWISTFHSFCEKILKERGIEIGLPEFKILTETEQWILLRKHLDEFNLDYYKPRGNPTKFVRALLTHFSRAKDEVIASERYLEHAKNLKLDGDSAELAENENKKITEVADAYHAYSQILLQEGALDFGDLINWTLKLFNERPQILAEYRAKFKYILVDEFQDTNFAQYELVKLLAQPTRNIGSFTSYSIGSETPYSNLTVVGDDDQSIYRFRGASMSNILTFDKDFPNSKKIVLTQNYRSGQNILDSAYKFISLNNPNRLEVKLGGNLSKKLSANVVIPGEVVLLEENSLDEEVAQIMRKIVELKNGIAASQTPRNDGQEPVSWNDFAILVRANDSAKPFIHQAELFGIPYQFMASRGLYHKPPVSHLIAFLKLLDNYRESSAMFKLLTLPVWGISAYDVADLNYHAKKKALSLYEICEHLELYCKNEGLIKKIKDIVAHLDKAREEAKIKKTSQIIYAFLDKQSILKYYTGLPDSAEKRNTFSYLNKFYKKIKEYERNNEGTHARDFLEMLEMELEAGDVGALPRDPDEGPEMIKISTVHAAKGLEFKYVFIANLVDKRFPSMERSEAIDLPKELVKEILPEGDIHLEEERRLFYVAMTRAKEKLFLTWGKDYGGARLKKPSRFLYEMGLIEMEAKKQKSMETISPSSVLPLGKGEEGGETEHISYSIPKHFSYSQLKAFESCPYQYKLRHILNIPTEGGYQASFGRSIHNTLQKFFIKINENAGKSQGTLFGAETASTFPTLASLEEIYNKEWIDDWYESQEAMMEHKKTGWNALKIYYEKLKMAPPKTPHLEQEFTIKFGDDSFKGVIDRIDELPDGKHLIMDYKTGKAPKEDKLAFDDKEQLLIYFLAARDILQLHPKTLALNFIIEDKIIEFTPKESDLEKIQDWVLEKIREIKSMDFTAQPKEHTCCFCDYKNICEFKV